MAWATWGVGLFLIVAGVMATFSGIEGDSMIKVGAGMIGTIVGIMVAGKVIHDNWKKE